MHRAVSFTQNNDQTVQALELHSNNIEICHSTLPYVHVSIYKCEHCFTDKLLISKS